MHAQVLAFACVRLGFVPNVNMTAETYVRAVLPIGALFACARFCIFKMKFRVTELCVETANMLLCTCLQRELQGTARNTAYCT